MSLDPGELRKRIADGDAIGDIAAALDGCTPGARRAEALELDRWHQRALWALCADAPPLTLSDFVPDDVPPLQPVAHHGRNTLPLGPMVLKRFTKWMFRGEDGRIGGYNASPFQLPIGPGYFVLRETDDAERARWSSSVVVDYFDVPRGPVPWPWVRPNWLGPQLFVYGHTRDYMRRVSTHVTLGAATKWGIPLGSYFVLVRGEMPPPG